MRTGKYRPEGDGTSVAAIIERYKGQLVSLKRSSAFHDSNLGILDRELGHLSMYDLSPNDVVKYVAKRRETVSSSTVRKEVNTLNHVIETALSLYDIDLPANPVHKAKTVLKYTDALADSKARARRLADGEEESLMSALAGAVEPKLATMLTLETGRRLRELLDIRPELISVVKGRPRLRVQYSKTGEAFTVPLSRNVAAIIKGLDKKVGEGLFTIRADSVSQAFARAVKRAGLHDLKLTDLRHEAFSRLFERGFDVPEVMAISGHKTPDVLLKVYAQVQAAALSDRL